MAGEQVRGHQRVIPCNPVTGYVWSLPMPNTWPASVRRAVRGCVVARVATGAPERWRCPQHGRPHADEARAVVRRLGVNPAARWGR